MSEPYDVSVSVPQNPQFTEQEKADLKDSFKATVVETLENKGVTDKDVTVEIVMPSGS